MKESVGIRTMALAGLFGTAMELMRRPRRGITFVIPPQRVTGATHFHARKQHPCKRRDRRNKKFAA